MRDARGRSRRTHASRLEGRVRCVRGLRIAGAVAVLALGGCARTVRTVVVQERDVERREPAVRDDEERTIVTGERVSAERDVRREPDGVLSAAMRVIGDVLALPFRLVARVIEAIF